ncbi:MAG: OmpA family protein [Paludibacteraceae bacterium]|nr:OmpA family protein [Paludibacteraceae bacterium]
MDKCPNEPGVSANGGCPAVEVEAPKTVTVSLGNVQFPIGKSFISKSSYTILNKAVKMMKEKPEAKLIITGHSDATGSSARNQVLSEERADQVKSYIIKKGVEKERITTSGKGDTTPIDSNETEAGRAKNRRATLDIEYQQEKAE